MKLPFRRRQPRRKVISPDDQMTLTEHLAELRMRIIRSILAVLVGFVVALAFYNQILGFLKEPLTEICKNPKLKCTPNADLVYFDVLAGFGTRIRLASYGGLIIAFPVIVWQIWRFVVPGLHAREKKYAVPFIVAVVFLFLLGAAIAYWTLPKALEFLIRFAGSDTAPLLAVDKYVRLVALMVLAFGVGLEFPVVLVFLQLVGALSYRTLLRQWRYALVGIVVLAAVITPSGDPISLAALSVPMGVFYFVAALIGRYIQKRREAAAAAV